MAMQAGQVISIREEQNAKTSLDDRIADAFSNALVSAELAQLLAEVARTNYAAKAEGEKAEARALDPKRRPAEVAEARRQMEYAIFRSKRLETAAEQLSGLLTSTRSREDAEARRIAHEAALIEREQLIEDLKEYDELSRKIAALMERIRASNAKFHGHATAEQRARGFPDQWAVNPEISWPALVDAVRLPKFRKDGTINGYLWPSFDR
ncbi:hypothetical protein [Pararhizobium sp. O133]|uniref:hypothetical protein n=1 Tax=Pararhizobium sp. O133 TaxID=3449278 RepID=UPI003F684A67